MHTICIQFSFVFTLPSSIPLVCIKLRSFCSFCCVAFSRARTHCLFNSWHFCIVRIKKCLTHSNFPGRNCAVFSDSTRCARYRQCNVGQQMHTRTFPSSKFLTEFAKRCNSRSLTRASAFDWTRIFAQNSGDGQAMVVNLLGR